MNVEQAEEVKVEKVLERPMITRNQLVGFVLLFIGASLILGFIMGIIEGVTKYPILNNWLTGYKGLIFDAVTFGIVLLVLPKMRQFSLQGFFNFSPFRKGKTYLIYLAKRYVGTGSCP